MTNATAMPPILFVSSIRQFRPALLTHVFGRLHKLIPTISTSLYFHIDLQPFDVGMVSVLIELIINWTGCYRDRNINDNIIIIMSGITLSLSALSKHFKHTLDTRDSFAG